MSIKWKRGITVAISLIVLFAFVITSFGCGTMKKEKHLPNEEQTVDTPEWFAPLNFL